MNCSNVLLTISLEFFGCPRCPKLTISRPLFNNNAKEVVQQVSERSETHHLQSNMFKMHFWPVSAKLSSLNSSNVSNILIWADIFNFTENFRKHEKQTSRVGHEVSLFPRLVLGGINTDSCNQIFILQNFQDLQNHLLANI